ncbi:PIG-L family deacetylase [Geodermatophilus aquaeductus]|uniref:N-acetylglucosaminyl deacetylase, LmbE family n=1 Tax=Geodermatophilus aquaeductus TaxID=1564161 RepID=A0A521FTR0_9ACTN|nr:PIG-L family deacetylase [Geodermatophilus aquaeductus]SMO99484.1 N-acetylglucosaminyl deacetylase, LmbE family [Geodermatophilus aquaeductus]
MPRNRTLACVFAHPDDDAYGAAGSVALHAGEPDFRFILIHATSGEQGDIRDGFPATRRTLGAIRQAEDEAGWRALGRVPDRHEWLGLPDGGVADVPREDVVVAIAQVLEEEEPAVVVTFGPDGIFGHPDHVAIGAATDEAFARLRPESTTGFQRLAHGAVPQSVFERWNRQRAELGLYTFDPTQMFNMRGVPDDQIQITVDCREVASQVVAGLREHKSQLHVMSDDPTNTEQWERRVRREWYTIASSGRATRGPMFTDLFDGVA